MELEVLVKTKSLKSSLVAQSIKDPVLSLKCLGSLLWHKFYPWPRNFHVLWRQPKKRKKKKKNHQNPPPKKTEKTKQTPKSSYRLILLL